MKHLLLQKCPIETEFLSKRLASLSLLVGLLVFLNLSLAACGNSETTGSQATPASDADSYRATANCNNGVQAAKTLTNPSGGAAIHLYSSLPLTGSSHAQSQTLVNSMQLAFDEAIANDPTLVGLKIEYISLDDATAKSGEWDKEAEALNARRVAADPKAVAYLGPFNSGAAQISIPILNQAGVVMLTPSATRVGLTKSLEGLSETGEPNKYYPTGTRNFFRIVTSDELQGQKEADYAVDTFKARRFFIFDDSGAYGKGLALSFEKAAIGRGGTVLGRKSIDGTEADYRELARQVRQLQPDLVFYGGSAQHQPGRLLADLRANGVTVPFLGGDGLNDPAFVNEAGIAGEGAIASISGLSLAKLPKAGQDFFTRYRAKYGEPTAYSIYGYEVMNVALAATKEAGKADRAAVLKNVASTKNFNGALGSWSFTPTGDSTLTDFAFYKIQGGCLLNQ